MKQKQDETVKKVAFLGTSPSSRHLAPFADDGWEVWGMGPAWQDEGTPTMPGSPNMRWHRWFELHPMKDNDPSFGEVVNPGYWEWLVKQDKPIYYRPPLHGGLKGEEFPWDELLEKHGSYFLDSTPAWMMAFAYEYFPDITDIGLYGVDFAACEERQNQKKGAYHFIRLFKLKGIEVHIPGASDLSYEPPPYPGLDPFKEKCQAQRQLLTGMLNKVESQIQNMKVALAQQESEMLRIHGAMEQVDYFEGNRT